MSRGRPARLAEEFSAAVGKTLWLTAKADMDTVTAVSGSGPAYFFLLIEMLERAAIALGLPPDVSRKLAIGNGVRLRLRWHTKRAESAAVLREQVTSKGGTTEAALRHLEAQDVRAMFAEASLRPRPTLGANSRTSSER